MGPAELNPLLQSYLLPSPSLNLSHRINPNVDKTQNINKPKSLKSENKTSRSKKQQIGRILLHPKKLPIISMFANLCKKQKL
jgi:hypothetical protein